MSNVQMDITTHNAKIKINNKFRKFKIVRNQPQMSIRRKTPTFKVNWDKIRAESGLANPKDFCEQRRQIAYRKTLEAIGKIAQKGDAMAEPTKNGNRIAEIVVENLRSTLPEFNMGTMPQSLAEIDWDNGIFEVNWSKGSFEIIWDDDIKPDIIVTPHSVEIKIRDFNKIKLQDKGKNNKVGKKIDRKV